MEDDVMVRDKRRGRGRSPVTGTRAPGNKGVPESESERADAVIP